MLLFLLLPAAAEAQTDLDNGRYHDGSITSNEEDVWTFTAQPGDRILVGAGQVSGSVAFAPRVRILNAASNLVGFSSSSPASTTSEAMVEFVAASAGAHTVVIDSALAGGAGTYRLYYLNLGNTFATAGGDQGGALTSGANHDGSIGLADVDPWTFQAAHADRVTLNVRQLSGGGGFSPWLRVFDSAGSPIAYSFSPATSTTSETEVTFVMPSAGEFIVLVQSGLPEGTGTYRLSYTLEPGPFGLPLPLGPELANGALHDASITLAFQTNDYHFEAQAGDTISVRLGETDDGSGFAPYLRLRGPNGEPLAEDAATAEAWVAITAPAGGLYFVHVSDLDTGAGDEANDTGSYRLELIRVPADFVLSPGDDGGALTNGLVHEGTTHVGDIDTWSFQAQAGELITVRLGETDDGSGFQPLLRLMAPDGMLLAEDTAPADGWVEAMAKVNGTYFVQVTDDDTGAGDDNEDTGSYRLELVRVPSNFLIAQGDEGGALTNGAVHEGAIHTGDVDTWTFQAQAGDRLTVRLGETDNGSGFHPLLRLLAPDGALLTQEAVPADGWVESVALQDGTYFVQVLDYDTGAGDDNDDTGSYRLELVRLPAPFVVQASDEGGALTNGLLHEGTIHVGDIDTWTLEAAVGQRISVRLGETDNGSGFHPLLRLLAPDGSLLMEEAAPADGWVESVATQAGTFFVQILDYDTGAGDDNDDTGSYRLELIMSPGEFLVSTGDQAGSIANGGVADGALHVGDLDTWTFEARPGDFLLVRVGEVDDGSGLHPFFRILGPNGEILGETAHANDAFLSVQAAAPGTHFIQVADYDTGAGDENDDTGEYRLHLVRAPAAIMAAALPQNANVPGTILRGDLHVWTFEADAGNRLTFAMQEVSGGTTFSPRLRVFGPAGQDLASHTHATLAQLLLDITDSGIFVLVADNGILGGTGEYTLTISGLPEQGKQLRVATPDADSLVVNWPAALSGYVLQHTRDLSTNGWEDAPMPVNGNSLNSRISVLIEGNQFFRLRPPDPQ